MINIILYSTVGCHLCEQVYELLQQCKTFPVKIDTIDIALDDDLVQKYGTSIPVLLFPDQTELNWPFSLQDLESKLKKTAAN